MRQLIRTAGVIAILVITACGGDNAVPTAPGPIGNANLTSPNGLVSVRIEGPSAMTVGETQHLKAVATLAGDATADVTARASFASSNTSVVTVSATGQMKALAPGKCQVTSIVDGLTAAIEVEVKAGIGSGDTVVELSLEGKTELQVGEKSTIKVLATLASGAEVDVTARASFTSSNSAIIKVSASGAIEAVAPGTCELISVLDGVKASLNVTVGGVVDAIVKLDLQTKTTLAVGDTTELKVLGTLQSGATLDVTARATLSSSNTAIVTVSASGQVVAVAPGTCDLISVVDGIRAAVSVTVATGADAIVKVDLQAKTSLEVGEKTQVKVIAALQSGATLDVTARAILSSSNTAIVKVSASGQVEAVGPGTCDLISVVDGIRVAVSVTVQAGADAIVKVDLQAKTSLEVGEKTQVKVIATLQSGATFDVTARATLSSSNPAIVQVSASGHVEAVAPGTCDLISVVDGIRAAVSVTVATGADAIVKVDLQAKTSLEVGEKTHVKVIATLQSGGTIDVTGQASFTSSDLTVAQVSGTGEIEAIGAGLCDIAAVVGGIKATISVSVSKRELTIVKLRIEGTATVKVGQTIQLKAIATMSDGSEQDVSTQVTWSSSNLGLCLIDLGGLLTALAPGDCLITATSGSVKGTVTVKVTLL